MLNDVITIIIISTLPFITGWYLGAFCQRRVDDRESQIIKERHQKELEDAFSEQAIVSNEFFTANQCQRANLERQIEEIIATNRHGIRLVSEELEKADLVLQDVFSVAKEVRSYREKMLNSAVLAHGKFDKIVHSIPSFKKMTDVLNGVQKLMAGIEQKSVQIRSIAAEAILLSTNAAMEASRAGESARDFASFADCVQVLSGKSTEAIMELYTSIDKTQVGIDEIVQQLEGDNPMKQDKDGVLTGFYDIEQCLRGLDEITSHSVSSLVRGRKIIQGLDIKIHSLSDSFSNGFNGLLDSADVEISKVVVESS